MPKPILPADGEHFPGPLEARAPGVADDTMRALGGTGLPTDDRIGRIDVNAMPAQDGAEFDDSNWALVHRAHELATEIFHGGVPSPAEFEAAGLDFAALQAGYERYAAAGFAPELVLFPFNVSVEEWEEIYDEFLVRQSAPSANSTTSELRNPPLNIDLDVQNHWDDISNFLSKSTPGIGAGQPEGRAWKYVVVPTADKSTFGLATYTSFDLSTRSAFFDEQLRIAQGAGRGDASPDDAHMPIDAYLTLQAMRMLKGEPLVSDDVWTWCAGSFSFEADTQRYAPTVMHSRLMSNITISCQLVENDSGNLGVRLPIWGGAKDA